jgi:hypothetical protein
MPHAGSGARAQTVLENDAAAGDGAAVDARPLVFPKQLVAGCGYGLNGKQL